jgi:N-acetylneuraminic acid mutarotase
MTAMSAWTDAAALKQIRSHPATVAWNGRLYVFGGGGPRFVSLNTVEVYDPRADRWEPAAPMPTLRSGAVAAVIDGRIWVVGGGFRKDDGKFRFLPTTEIYDPARDAWEAGPDMTQPHDYPALGLLDGTIYILGGHHPDATEGGPSSDPGFAYCERLGPSAVGWEPIAPMPTPRFAPMGVVWGGRVWAVGGCAYVAAAGGVRDFDRIERFDPATGAWDTPGFSMPWPAAAHGVAQGGDAGRTVYVVGGYSGPGIHARAAAFDAETGAARDLPSLNAPRAAMGTAILDGVLYAVGGWQGDGRTVTDRVEKLPLAGL